MDSQQDIRLSAREIFNKILQGNVVSLPPLDPLSFSRLESHLNSIRSYDKKLFESLGLEFTKKVIRCVKDAEGKVTIFLDDRKDKKKFSIFSIDLLKKES